MSIDINWDTITSGPDGVALAEKIRAFLHDKFQEVVLPRFINSVQVNAFNFGKVGPEIEIKDICDPLPDFYEEDESDEEVILDDKARQIQIDRAPNQLNQDRLQRLQDQILRGQDGRAPTSGAATRNGQGHDEDLSRLDRRGAAPPLLAEQPGGLFPRSGTPGIPGGVSNLGYFNLPIGGVSGSQTPLAAVAGGTSFPISSWQRHTEQQSGFPLGHAGLGHTPQLAPPSDMHTGPVRRTASHSRRPSTANTIPSVDLGSPASVATPDKRARQPQMPEASSNELAGEDGISPHATRSHSVQATDVQIVARVKYAGDVQMTLTAEILLDYPMPSFVGIPMQLAITGVTFDGVAIVTYIKNRMHFCFLSPDDADALVGDRVHKSMIDAPSKHDGRPAAGGLLHEIRVESEIGRKETGKQVLKNVGKVEKFVLEQVRQIFEEEFVFPSFWTFLV